MAETHVYLAQCLCGSPNRHCIVAASGEADNAAQAKQNIATPLRALVIAMIVSGEINPRCGICGATDKQWFVEIGRTPFRTMAEATPALVDIQQRIIDTRELLSGHPGPGRTH